MRSEPVQRGFINIISHNIIFILKDRKQFALNKTIFFLCTLSRLGLCLLQTTDLQKPSLTRGDVLTIILASLYLVLGAFIFGLVTTLAITNDIRPRQLQ